MDCVIVCRHGSFYNMSLVLQDGTALAEDLFAVVADVDRYQEFVPFCAGSRVLRRTSHTRFEAELEIGFRLFNERYVSDVSLVPGESVTAEAVRTPGGLFERLVSTWRFERGAHPPRVRGQV
jgi:coenzyme Q-binding protein COQ10